MSLTQAPTVYINEGNNPPAAEVRTEKASGRPNTPRRAVQRLIHEYRNLLRGTDCPSLPPQKDQKKGCKPPHVGVLPNNGNHGLKDADVPDRMSASHQMRASGTLSAQHHRKTLADSEGREDSKAPRFDEVMDQLGQREWTRGNSKSSGFVAPLERGGRTDFHLARNLKQELRRVENIGATADKQTRINTAASMEKPELGEASRGEFLGTMESVRGRLIAHLTAMASERKSWEVQRGRMRSNKGEFLDDREQITDTGYEEAADSAESVELNEWDASDDNDDLAALMAKYPEAGVAPQTREELYADLLTPEGDGTPADMMYAHLEEKYADQLTPEESDAVYYAALAERYEGFVPAGTNGGNGKAVPVAHDPAKDPLRRARVSSKVSRHDLELGGAEA